MEPLNHFHARRELPPRITLASAALALLTLVLVGCGSGTHPARSVHSDRRSAPRVEPYRWLVRTAGPQPNIARENRYRGTRAWRLPGSAAEVGGKARGTVRGYVAEQALRPGQTERIYVSAPGSTAVRIEVFRIGWYDGRGGREVLLSRWLPVARQPACAHRFATGLTECDWRPTLSFMIPSALPSGVYIAKLSARTGVSDCLFVVRASLPALLLAQLPTATYEAYNAWGGDSLYPGGSDRVGATGTTQGIEVSYDRPYDSITGAGEFFARDVAMVRFLERYGYPISYTTSESVDVDPGQLAGHRAVIDFGHSEYWSERQARAFAQARDRGISLLLFGSDTLAWRIRYGRASSRASERSQPDHTIIAYKEHAALDPDRSEATGPFADRGATLAGSAYLGCITPRLRQPGPPTYRYYEWQPAPALQPRWLFAGTRISTTTRIPGIVGYELDARTAASPPDTQLLGFGFTPCMASRFTEPGGPLPGARGGVAQTTLYTARSGAIVFDTGMLGWELGLEPVPSASPDAPRAPDPRLVAITRNLLARVLRSR
jgi:hypothetical protein